ncbi:hypothetical protein [Nocardia cyriacigeorgica]|uniref:hypothetical protein n=1 Tax=Nocardia cyriacigeorgica TaxID=135487 RepID=UPI0014862571|nr:hypothetical protein [Nocardia cyriacigeorgica]
MTDLDPRVGLAFDRTYACTEDDPADRAAPLLDIAARAKAPTGADNTEVMG